jgi:hypothetical protein
MSPPRQGALVFPYFQTERPVAMVLVRWEGHEANYFPGVSIVAAISFGGVQAWENARYQQTRAGETDAAYVR